MTEGLQTAFAPGQVWRYETRPHEQASRLEILKVEREADVSVVHIRLVDLGILTAGLSGGQAPEVEHIPITEAALRASVVERILIPASDAGPMMAYYQWREAFDLGEAGVFDLPVKDVIAALEEGIAQLLANEGGGEDDREAGNGG